MRGNFGLFCSFSPKLPRITLDYIEIQMRKLTVERAITMQFKKLELLVLLFK